jgi:Family of unknown function (DUF6318)
MRIRVALRAVVVPALLAGLTGLAGLVGGCTGDDDGYGTLPSPTASTPTTAAASPSASPTLPPPMMPALARQDSPTGAEAFARHWLTALDYAYQTGNTKPVRGLGDCGGCVSLANGIDRIYNEGGHVEGGKFTILSSAASRHVAGKAAAVQLVYSRTRRRVVEGNGDISEDPAATRLGFLVILDRSAGNWSVDQFPILK